MSILGHRLAGRIPFVRKRQPQLTKEQAMAVRPLINPVLTWSLNEKGEVSIVIPVRNDRTGRILARLFGSPKNKQLVLDDVGSSVWILCDGQHGVGHIITAVCEKYKLNRREAETSVTMYLKMLAERNLIGLLSGAKKEPQPASGRKKK